MDTTLMPALAAGLTSVVFLIGFASVRLRGQRDRALSRSDAIANNLAQRSADGKLITDREVERSAHAYADAYRLDPMSKWTVLTTWLIVGMMLVLATVSALGARRTLTPNVLDWAPDTWSVGFVLVVATGIALIGTVEFRWIRSDINLRRDSSPIGRVEKALRARSEDKLDEALTEINAVINDFDSWPWAFAFRSKLHSGEDNFQASIRDLDRALVLDPDNVWYRVARAELLLDENEPERALSDLEHLGQRLPQEPQVLRLHGSALYGVGRRDESLLVFSRALSEQPEDITTRIARGRALADQSSSFHEGHGPAEALRSILLDEGQRIAVASVTSKARKRLFQNDLKTAVEDFSLVLDHDKANVEALVLRGHARLRLGRLGEAKEDFDEALALGKRESFVLRQMAFAYRTVGDLEHSAELFGRAITLRANAHDYFQRGLTFHQLGRYAEAVSDFDESLRLRPNLSEAGSHRALSLTRLTRYDEADLQFREVELSSEENVHNYSLWVQSLLESREDAAQALEVADRAIDAIPFDGLLHSIRGRVHAALSRYASAHADFDAAESLGADKSLVALDRSHAYLEAGELDAAEKTLSDAEGGSSHYQHAMLATRATLLRRLGRESEALELYDQAIELSLDISRFLVSRACLLMSMGEWDRATLDLDRSLGIDPKSLAALSHRAEARSVTGNIEGALIDLSLLESLGGSSNLGAYLRGKIHFQRGEWKEACTQYRLALADGMAEREMELLSSLAAAYDNLGEFKDAEVLFRRIAHSDPHPTSFLRLGICLSQQGKSDEAVKLFRSVREQLGDAAQAQFEMNVLPDVLLEADKVLANWAASLG